MQRKSLILLAFVFVAAAQIYVPASMVLEYGEIIETGSIYKFKTAPVDPNDPLRGKYVTLSFERNLFRINGVTDFVRGQDIFVMLKEDRDGFADIRDIVHESPDNSSDFVKAKISAISFDSDSTSLYIDYPFDRFYMEENKAPMAEETFNKAQRESAKITYAIVKIKDGNAALEDVMIDGKSLQEIIDSSHTK